MRAFIISTLLGGIEGEDFRQRAQRDAVASESSFLLGLHHGSWRARRTKSIRKTTKYRYSAPSIEERYRLTRLKMIVAGIGVDTDLPCAVIRKLKAPR
jgi:hypothetical protein